MSCRFTFLLLPVLLWLGCGRVGFGIWGQDDDVDPIGPVPWPDDDSPHDPGDGSDDPDAEVGPPITPPNPNDAGAPTPPDGGTPASDGGPAGDGGSWPLPDGGSGPWPPGDGGTRPDGGRPQGGGCRGECVSDMCWYLSAPGESCEEACRDHGGTDRRAAKEVGAPSQGGSAEECARIMRALDVSRDVKTGTRSDGLGLGCHRFSDGVSWWLSEPAFDASAKSPDAERACACED